MRMDIWDLRSLHQSETNQSVGYLWKNIQTKQDDMIGKPDKSSILS